MDAEQAARSRAQHDAPAEGAEDACTVRLLGPIELSVLGRPVDLGPPKQRALLAALALQPAQVVASAHLVELVWGEHPPRTAQHSVQIYVSALRLSLSSTPGAPTIVTVARGNRLDVEPMSVDVTRFEALVQAGMRAACERRPAEARSILAAGLSLWRGEVLSDVRDAPVAVDAVHRCGRLRLEAAEALAAAHLDMDEPEEAAGLAEQVLAVDPLRDRACELLIVALYRTGRHAAALRTYGEHRRRLREELGVDPSPVVRRVHEQVLAHDSGSLAPATPATGVRNPYRGLLPFTESDAKVFSGRDALVRQVLENCGPAPDW